MPTPTRRLSYANVASTLALVLAVGGGGAAVAAGLEKNSVGSKQIKNGAVKTVDLKKEAVKGAQVAADSLGGADIDESSLASVPKADLSNRAGNVLTAAVTSAGALNTDGVNRGATSAAQVVPGQYEVIFDRDVTSCAYVATAGQLGTSSPSPTFVTAVRRSANPNGIFVRTRDSAGADANTAFFAVVVC